MATLQVKGINDQLYAMLKRRAELEHRSISQEVISIIQDYLAQPTKKNQKATIEFLKLSGSWEKGKSSEEIVKELKNNRSKSGRDIDFKNVFD